MAKKLKPKEKPHYVNNREFSEAVMDYAVIARDARENQTQVPKVTDYIAKCFIRIAEGLSHRPNFVRYTYREEMVMDAVENCLRAIANYNIETGVHYYPCHLLDLFKTNYQLEQSLSFYEKTLSSFCILQMYLDWGHNQYNVFR